MKGFWDELHPSVELLEGSVSLKDLITNLINDQTCAMKASFFVADLGMVVKQHILWRSKLEWIRPFYPVKCNSSPLVLKTLAALGTGFVCSNKREMELVKGFGVAAHDIILGGACKQLSQVKHAAKNNVDLLVCDNETEMRKIARYHPKANLLLWLRSECCCKREDTIFPFGSSLKDCGHLMRSAVDLGLSVIGVKLSVPGYCQETYSFARAVADARCIFDMGEDLGFKMNILDIGDPFDESGAQLDKVSEALKPMLDVCFPLSTGVSIIAEPGTFYVSSAFTLVVNIIDKKTVVRDSSGQPHSVPSLNDEPEIHYIMSDGVYGSFAKKLLGEELISAPSLLRDVSAEELLFSSSLWGPSEDELDQIADRCLLPELSVGDWLLFQNAGESVQGSMFSDGEHQKPAVFHCIAGCDWKEIHSCGLTLDIRMKKVSLVPKLYNASISTPA